MCFTNHKAEDGFEKPVKISEHELTCRTSTYFRHDDQEPRVDGVVCQTSAVDLLTVLEGHGNAWPSDLRALYIFDALQAAGACALDRYAHVEDEHVIVASVSLFTPLAR